MGVSQMLTDTAIRDAKSRDKAYKLFDERGLYLLVAPTGGRLWRFRYRHGAKEKLLSLGAYPDVPLKRAREKRDEARRLVADGVDPSANRKSKKAALANTFQVVAREWLKMLAGTIKGSTFEQELSQMERFVFPDLGDRPLAEINTTQILSVLKKIEARGVADTSHRVRSSCVRILRYGAQTGRPHCVNYDDLKGALAPVVKRHFAAITDPAAVGELLRAIDGYMGQATTVSALRLAPYVFVRPGELRAAEWSEFDFNNAEWRIPAARMKMGEQHIVPLAQQAAAILRGLYPLTGSGQYVFPSLLSRDRPMSENTVNSALRRLGYSTEQMTAHGFRTMASTLLNEQGWHPDLIELQLAHAERNKVRAAYNKAQRLTERRAMVQAWADFLDGLRAGGTIVPLRRTA
jgi:integrase